MIVTKYSINAVIVTVISLSVIFTLYNNFFSKKELIKENFEEKGVVKEIVEQIYDQFYSRIYDKIFHSDFRVQYEINSIHEMFLKKWKGNLKILDLGCGTGTHIESLRKLKYNVDGIDISEDMQKVSKKLNPSCVIKLGNFEDKKNFKLREYSHITSFFYTIYYSRSFDNVFRNVNYSLVPNGIFFVHVINKQKFDPVLEKATNLVPLYDPQKYNKERKSNTILNFNNMVYKSDWDFSHKTNVKFKEVFEFDDGNIKQNIHHLTIPSLKKIVKSANNNGFKLIKIIDLYPANHPNNYIYCFKKIYGM